ncbi:hypothetical protein cco71_05072 [Campylobacter coli 317/04]|nr:hypothetical protein YSS_08740 [Campylobacter coli RM4661]EIA91061.1 hypothetical protein cco71_05072 [Campylobacter coli 317/04]
MKKHVIIYPKIYENFSKIIAKNILKWKHEYNLE